MIPDNEKIDHLLKKYSANDKKLELIRTHGLIVEQIAMEVVSRQQLKVDMDLLRSACRIHDIGSFLLMDENGDIDIDYYQLHGLIGSKILEEEGVDIRICKMIETHQFTIQDKETRSRIKARSPQKTYAPATIEADLLSFADRFHSKRPVFNSLEFLNKQLKSAEELRPKFDEWILKYGVPDILKLSKIFNHPIR